MRVPVIVFVFWFHVAWMPGSRGCIGLAGSLGEGCEHLTFILKPARVGVELAVSGRLVMEHGVQGGTIGTPCYATLPFGG